MAGLRTRPHRTDGPADGQSKQAHVGDCPGFRRWSRDQFSPRSGVYSRDPRVPAVGDTKNGVIAGIHGNAMSLADPSHLSDIRLDIIYGPALNPGNEALPAASRTSTW